MLDFVKKALIGVTRFNSITKITQFCHFPVSVGLPRLTKVIMKFPMTKTTSITIITSNTNITSITIITRFPDIIDSPDSLNPSDLSKSPNHRNSASSEQFLCVTCNNFIGKASRIQWLQWCHYGLWRWYTGKTHKIILASTSTIVQFSNICKTFIIIR